MNTNHLSAWEQEEYILQQDADQQTLHHLQECAQCRDAVARLQGGLAGFRSAAVDWSSKCLGPGRNSGNLCRAEGCMS
jgi:hypothetical protein